MSGCSAAAIELAPTRAAPAQGDLTLARTFKTAMRRVASTVMLVTTVDEQGAPHGMAASSVISVSMEPPSMLVAVNRDASMHPVLARTRRYCVNVLGSGQLDLLAPFSQSSLRGQRFASGDWRRGIDGLPFLGSAPAAIFCEADQLIDYGTHTLCLGRVIDVAFGSEPQPLVWLDGAAR